MSGYKSLLTKNLLELLVSVDQNAETTVRYTDEEMMDAAKKEGKDCEKMFTEK